MANTTPLVPTVSATTPGWTTPTPTACAAWSAALTEYENDRNDDAGRRADEQIAAGLSPF